MWPFMNLTVVQKYNKGIWRSLQAALSVVKVCFWKCYKMFGLERDFFPHLMKIWRPTPRMHSHKKMRESDGFLSLAVDYSSGHSKFKESVKHSTPFSQSNVLNQNKIALIEGEWNIRLCHRAASKERWSVRSRNYDSKKPSINYSHFGLPIVYAKECMEHFKAYKTTQLTLYFLLKYWFEVN